MKNIGNILIYAFIALVVIGNLIGAWVQFSTERIWGIVMLTSSFAFLAGMFFGRWTKQKEHEESTVVRIRNNTK